MNFRNVKFERSVAHDSPLFNYDLPEVLFIGRSNVGKSSLINTLTSQKKLAYTSKKPGHTKLLNFYNVDKTIMFVDAPGYGYAKGDRKHYEQFGILLDSYFTNEKKLALILFLLDSRRVPNEDDVLFYDFVTKYEIPIIVVVTKVDKVNQKEKAAIIKNFETAIPTITKHQMFYVSSLSKRGVPELQKYLETIK